MCRPARAGEPPQRERSVLQLLRICDGAKWVCGEGVRNRLPEAEREGRGVQSEPRPLQVRLLVRREQGERDEDVLPTELQLPRLRLFPNKHVHCSVSFPTGDSSVFSFPTGDSSSVPTLRMGTPFMITSSQLGSLWKRTSSSTTTPHASSPPSPLFTVSTRDP